MSAVIARNHQAIPKYIYNHDIMNCTADGVIGNHLYSGRALGITEPWDLLQLHSDLKPLWDDIVAHYDRIGLSHTKEVIWYLDLKQLGSHIGHHPSVFYFGPNEYGNWGDHEWYKAVEFINSKNNFMSLANEIGVDIPKTLCFNSVDDIDVSTIKDMEFPCYLKAAISVSGVGIYRCENFGELITDIVKFDRDTPVQIQEEIKTDVFLNLQYQVIGDELIRLTASEQLLDGFAHQGNRVPACHAPWKSVEPMAVWLKDHGMKDIFAFDVAVVETDNGLRFPAIECNPRFNGASYPTLIAQKLGIPEWTAITFSTKHTSLNKIDLTDIEYDIKTGEGAIIVNWGTALVGKLMILMAGSRDYQNALKIELDARL
ncbi:MAG: ATP-grasp domain-containing protein [Gammaproteobacteria bacterium]|nr:ATP-grasp domain-containing protein [Gammaproteobacteria bacterium]